MEELGCAPQAARSRRSRRGFFQAGILGLGAAIAAALGLPALAYLLTPPKSGQQDAWIEIGELNKFAAGAPLEVATQSHRRLEGGQREGHRLGGKTRRRRRDGLRPAVYSPWMRLSLG